MKKLRLLIFVFTLALSIPLAYFVLRTYHGLEQEEIATLSYFAETLFDNMEQSLAVMVQTEESRAIDEYNFLISPSDRQTDAGRRRPSPLSQLTGENYVLGYFQNNPDGSFQSPLVGSGGKISPDRADLVAELKAANQIFNRKRATGTDRIQPRPAEIAVGEKAQKKIGLAEKYLDSSRSRRSREYLGQKEKRVEQITVNQAANIAKQEQPQSMSRILVDGKFEATKDEWYQDQSVATAKVRAPKKDNALSFRQEEAESDPASAPPSDADPAADYQVEVAPLQAVFLSDARVFIFRRIMINNQIYRQGFVLRVNPFLKHLAQAHFLTQPMAQFTGLRLSAVDQGRETGVNVAGVGARDPDVVLERSFPSPFGFLKATLSCEQIPRSAGRKTLNIMLIFLAVIVLMGLFAIYQSTRSIFELSERRSEFVSSVTHELKTPLTNIRMYIEMLEQGIARTAEREQEYYRILDSEGARLSRLINNVLELSKLEQKQRHIDLQPGNFEDVIREVQTVMAEKIKQEGYVLTAETRIVGPFRYDREVMLQVLINLIENSMKFGKSAPRREIGIRTRQAKDGVKISVSDTGPGIPRQDLKKVFEDFYRVENSLTRTTRGTGIGLALVKKFVRLMGGSVAAANNEGPGCTITITLPGQS